MKHGDHSEFRDGYSLHVNPVDAIIRNSKRRTDRYWKWWVMRETDGTVIAVGSALTKAEALEQMDAAILG